MADAISGQSPAAAGAVAGNGARPAGDPLTLAGRTLQEMASYPVLLCPVASISAFRHGERSWIVEGREVAYLDAVRHTQWFNVLAAPAVVVPVGQSPEGLPIGVQIVARPYEDEVALAVAGVLDKAFGYRHPPLARSTQNSY